MVRFLLITVVFILTGSISRALVAQSSPKKNIVFILSDDHRYDFMGFTGKVPFLETPNMDRMAREGAHLKNAFVSTSLCSPSRASILTGQYAHRHQVVDNQSLVPEGLAFFPSYLQQEGYATGFVGKWHMGEHHDDPRPGFDYWASFRGQGKYYNPTINLNGTRVAHRDSAYVTDVLTDYAIDFMEQQEAGEPFFLYLSHKAVHSEFYPAQRHYGKYEKEPITYPKTMFPPGHPEALADSTSYNYRDLPNWVKAQRYSWHGVDYLYHGAYDFDTFYRRYCETLLALDESIGAVLKYLEENGLMENTVIFYMGDNGFSFGEHGLIDKRQAYEESMRVPLLVMDPQKIAAGAVIEQVVQNIDIAPTILDIAGLERQRGMDGASFAPLLYGQELEWRDTVFYEYFWERAFPQTPTTHAVRNSRYKYIRYHGIWDVNELYDLQEDPEEMNNLIRSEAHSEIARDLNQQLFKWLYATDGDCIPLKKDHGKRFDHRYRGTY
jgi:arylsulfatase A-like enzyme